MVFPGHKKTWNQKNGTTRLGPAFPWSVGRIKDARNTAFAIALASRYQVNKTVTNPIPSILLFPTLSLLKNTYSPITTNDSHPPNLISIYAGLLTHAKNLPISKESSRTSCNLTTKERNMDQSRRSRRTQNAYEYHQFAHWALLTLQMPTMSFPQGEVFRQPTMWPLSEAWTGLCIWGGSEDCDFGGVFSLLICEFMQG